MTFRMFNCIFVEIKWFKSVAFIAFFSVIDDYTNTISCWKRDEWLSLHASTPTVFQFGWRYLPKLSNVLLKVNLLCHLKLFSCELSLIQCKSKKKDAQYILIYQQLLPNFCNCYSTIRKNHLITHWFVLPLLWKP